MAVASGVDAVADDAVFVEMGAVSMSDAPAVAVAAADLKLHSHQD